MALPTIYIFIVMTFLYVLQSYGSERHLICKSVHDVFSHSTFGGSSSGAVEGPPGKRGVPGSKGEEGSPGRKGDKGSPAIVNYQRIEEVIERTVTGRVTELTQRLQNDLNRLNEVVSCTQKGGFATDENCFNVIKVRANYAKALQLCADIGAKPAEIHSLEEQNRIEYYARPVVSGSRVEFWLGITYQPSMNAFRLFNGTTVNNDFRWHPCCPRSQAYNTKMLLQVRRDATAVYNGLVNTVSSQTTEGVICMKPFENA